MSYLDKIAERCRGINVNNPARFDQEWLIARVRKLEEGLTRIRDDDYVDTKIAAFAAAMLKEN